MLKLTLLFLLASVCVFAGPCGWDWCYSPQEYCSNPPQCSPPDANGMLTEISDCGYYPFGSKVIMNMWARYSSSWTYSHGACIRVRQERVHGPTLVTAIPLRIVL